MDLAYAKMVADTQYGAGGLYFYEEYFEWRPKSGALMNLRFMIRYDELDDIKITPTRKSQVIITTKDGRQYTVMIHKVDSFTGFINERLENLKYKKQATVENARKPKEVEHKAAKAEDPLAQLTKLAELREKNLLTEEEFTAAKKKLLGLE